LCAVREQLTDLQLSLMKALWELGEGSAGEVLAVLKREGHEFAPTTVATLLQRLSRQGWVKHRKNGRHLLYRAAVSQEATRERALRRVLSSFFGGRVSALTAQLLESEKLSAEELAALRKLLEHKRA
jgi:BlaI family transcriptional regulator, penicillinase repressor